ncbi:zinc finger protein 277-like [Haliotis rufescens]|uniref:zinc finger protein 277-like n=1 Tax=Haliotis rufescens TaxID=6454 RepID=UPI00201F1E79|nr:zinc finger protein 277-like [Haliotis rufescens]
MAASMAGSSEKPVLETLNLSTFSDVDEEDDPADKSAQREATLSCSCALCDETFNIEDKKDHLLAHMIMAHKFVVADVNLIAEFKRYILYWKKRFKEEPLKDFCTTIITNTGATDKAPREEFLMLSDVLPEDKQLREFLQKNKLEEILKVQQREREDTHFSRSCLFCSQHFQGNRAELFNHMVQDHAFNVGQPDNLVFTDEFLDILQGKLQKFLCLYCEKTFRDRPTLKEHMRKKQHRKINPKNKKYDKFYIINYQEMGRSWEAIQSEEDVAADDAAETERETDEEDEWSGWLEEAGSQALCLFCEFSSSIPDRLQAHMVELHDFDLHELKLKLTLNFYQKVKLINFIRRQIHQSICYGCQGTWDSRHHLLEHMHSMRHINSIPDIRVWDQPQYYFPTYENDNLLCQLDDDDSDDRSCSTDDGAPVIAEDIPVKDTILTDEHLRQEILWS